MVTHTLTHDLHRLGVGFVTPTKWRGKANQEIKYKGATIKLFSELGIQKACKRIEQTTSLCFTLSLYYRCTASAMPTQSFTFRD